MPKHHPIHTRSRRATFGLVLVAAGLISACGGGGDSNGDGTATVTAVHLVPMLTVTTTPATVVLPSGVAVGLDTLKVRTSIDDATPNAAGAATLKRYDNGAQLAIVLSPSGAPMLMGWIDATHTTISAATTAQVMAYFALNGALTLNMAERQVMIDGMAAAPGIDALTTTIASELVRSTDAFTSRNATLVAAMKTFATPLFAAARSAGTSGRAHPQAISISPDVQSGITVVQDPPFAAHLSNRFRRRAHAFVDRVSHTTAGTDVADAASVMEFDVPPVIGVSGGVTGAITDIMNAYYGNQPTAYADITAPDGGIPLPLIDGSDKTTYQIAVVGPGTFANDYAKLTAAQKLAQSEVSWRGFIKDFLVPTMSNVILGSGAIDFTGGQATDKGKFLADVATALAADDIAFQAAYPGIDDKIAKGQWFDAGVDLTGTIAASNTLTSLLVGAFGVAANKYNSLIDLVDPKKVNLVGAGELMKSFDEVMDAAGGALQAFDSTVYINNVEESNTADLWTVAVTASKVALNPPASTIDVGGTAVLKASVLGVEDATGYSYHWTTTTQFGDLNEIAGGGRTHQTDYCSSSGEALFVYEKTAPDDTVDTVTAQVYSGPNCDPAKLVGAKQATVKFSPDRWVGTWVGSIVSTCGYYSGPITFFITNIGNNTNHFVYQANGFGGGYNVPYSGNNSVPPGGWVLDGDNLTSFPDAVSCQTGHYKRQ